MPRRSLAAALSLAILAGCATRSVELAPASPDRPWTPATDASGAIVAGARPAPAATPTYVLPINTGIPMRSDESQIDSEHAYTLPELIDMAQSNNPATRVAWNDAKQAALAVGLTKSLYLPRLSASAAGAYQHSHDDQSLGAIDASGDRDARGYLGAASLQWLLFDFGQRDALVRGSEQLSIAANVAFNGAHQLVVARVSTAFYEDVAAHAEEQNAIAALADVRAVESSAEERFAHGQGTVMEVAQARQATASAELAIVRSRGRSADARVGLLVAVGIPPLSAIRIVDVAEAPVASDSADIADGMVSGAVRRRPDVLAAYASEQAAMEGVRAARADFLPKVFASATADYVHGRLDIPSLPSIGGGQTTDNLSASGRRATVVVGVTVPIYDGGVRAARLEQARARSDAAAATLEQVRDNAVREIVLAKNDLDTSQAALNASQSLLSLSKTRFDASFAAYRQGVGSITDLESAGAALLDARSAATRAHSAVLSAAAALALAIGGIGGSG